MRNRWTIFWILVLFLGVGFLVWQFAPLRKKVKPAAESSAVTTLPKGEKVDISDAEVARMAAALASGKERWRTDVVEVVRRDRERLGIDKNAEIREQGEYVRLENGRRRTLVFALTPGLELGAQKTVLVEEYPPGFWVPKEVGPFFILVDRVGK